MNMGDGTLPVVSISHDINIADIIMGLLSHTLLCGHFPFPRLAGDTKMTNVKYTL